MKKLLIPALLSLLLLLPASCSQMEEDAIYGDAITKAEAQHFVDSLMTAFREGTLERLRCPRVRWEHIPALLEYGKSTKIIGDDPASGRIRALPANPISSYLMAQCSEGMFALWMVEAARINTLYKGNPPERECGTDARPVLSVQYERPGGAAGQRQGRPEVPAFLTIRS